MLLDDDVLSFPYRFVSGAMMRPLETPHPALATGSGTTGATGTGGRARSAAAAAAAGGSTCATCPPGYS